MMTEITISCGQLSVQAWLNQSSTAEAIIAALPLTGQANTWGEEIYFEIPVDMPQEPDARTEVEEGDLGYWPAGNALCIFFGPTPVSNGEKPKAYKPGQPNRICNRRCQAVQGGQGWGRDSHLLFTAGDLIGLTCAQAGSAPQRSHNPSTICLTRPGPR